MEFNKIIDENFNYSYEENKNGKFWYLNCELHRDEVDENGNLLPAKISNRFRFISWHKHGKLHREDGPAIEWADGAKTWYQDDKMHREDGPAVEHPNGTKDWYINGEFIKRENPK